MNDWVVYMLECVDGSIYTGCTPNVERRFRMHLAGKGSKYVRSRLPCVLVYVGPLESKSNALRREAAMKKLPRDEKLRTAGILK